jgi:orotate phosphoribosyltransferase
MDKYSLLRDYLNAGILQFGNFELTDGSFSPLGFHFGLLSSFPAVLSATADLLTPYFQPETPRDRMIVMPDSIALGGVIAVKTGLPLLYPRDRILSYTGAYAIEGTADVGNPMRLLTPVLLNGQDELLIMERAKRVGLPVQRVIAILDTQKPAPDLRQQTQVQALFTLTEVIDYWQTSRQISASLAKAILDWHKSD